MAKKVTANGKTFTFSEDATVEQIRQALDEYFKKNPQSSQVAGEKKKDPSKMAGSVDYGKSSQAGSIDFGLPTKGEAKPEGSMVGEDNPIVYNIGKLQTEPTRKTKKAPVEQDLRKVDTSMPSDVIDTSPAMQDKAESLVKTPQGEFYDVLRKKENDPRRVDTFDKGTDEYNDALVRDKIDYLWNIGETDAANQLKETYEEILSEKGSGDLSRGQEEKYRELITQAQVDNNEYIQKELRVVDSKYKVKDFYKDNASTIQEINKLASEIDLGVSNERRNVLESQINALQGVLKDSMDKTGITADVLDAYSNIASKFVDPRIVYEKATTQHLREAETSNTIGAERQADVQKYMGALTPIQVAGQSTHRAVDAFAETVVNGALSIVMQTPKVLGDLLGDTDYDWADEAYDKASGLKNYVREEMSWGNEEDAPTYMMLSRVFGQAAGSMATMSGGGALANMVKATQTATKAGTFGTTMMMQMADNYESALDEGMDQQEAALFGTWSSILSATIEQIAPEGVPPMKMTRLRDAIKEGLRGKELADVALDSFWQYSKNITKEGGEEVFEAAVGDINKQLAGYNPENLFSPKEYKEAVLGAVMVGGAMTAFRSKKSRPYMVAESLYDIAEITEANLPTMTKESLKTQKEMHEIRVSLEAVPTFGQLDKESKVLAFDAMLRKLDLEQAQKEVGEVDGGQIAAEIEKVNNELKEILTPKAEVKAVEETENIPVLPAEEVVQETQTTQQNNETASEPYQDLGVQGQDQKGNARGSADTKVAEPASKRNPNEIEAVIRKRDEQIGQILFDSNRGDRDNDTGKQGMDRDTTPQAILGDRGEQNDEGVGGILDGQTNDRGDGESASALQARVKDARQQLESKVNSLLSKSKSYNNYKLSVRQSNVGQNKLNEIKKEAASLGLNISYLGGKVRITNKEGKGVMPRGTARKIQEDNEVFKRAMDMTSPDEYVEVSKRLIQGSLKVSPNMFSEMTGLQEDSAEFKAAKRSGLISNKGVNDVGKYVSERMNDAGNTFDVDKVKDSLNLLLTSTKGDIKSNLIKTIRDREASQTKSEDQQKFDSEIDTIVEQATESFEKSGKTDRVEFIENAIKQLSRKNDLFDETTLENEALKKFRNDELVREREKNYTPYDTDETFSEGGEDAPFQEIDDKSVEAINIFYDAYDKGDLGDAIDSVMDFIDANPEARAGFEQHLRENRDTLVAGKKKEKKIMAVKSREDFKNAIKELVPQISDTDIESLAIVGDAMVKYALKLDRDLSNSEAWEVVQGHITNDLSNVIGLTQGVKGATSVEKGITAYTEAADISTLIHEPAHNFLGLLEYMAANGNEKAAAHIETINKFAKGEEGRKFFERSKEAGESWAKGEYNENDPTFRQELFARSAEKYFIEGNKTGFSTQMAQVFESFAKFLKDLYKSIKNSPELIELSDEMRSLFDAIYGKEAVEELNSLGDTRKLRNVIRAFVENSNLPAKDKERLAKNPDNIAEVFSFESMEKLVDDLISSYGIDAVVDEAMKEFSAIPLELKSVVYGRGLMDLRKRIKTSSGNTRDSLQERYDNIYEVAARLAHTAGVYNAYFAEIYRQDPEAVAKSIRKNFRKTMNSEVDMERAEDAATEVKKELEKEEVIAEVLEEYDILSSIDDLKQLEKAIKATEAKIQKLKKESKIVATAVSITKDGKAPTRDRAIAKMKANEAAKKFKDSFTKKTLNANINPEMLVYGVDWARWTLIGKAMDFASFFDTGVKTFGSDAQGLMGEFYKGAVKELRAEGYDVSMLTEDSSVDEFMKVVEDKIAQLEKIKEQKEIQEKIAKLSIKMSSKIGKSISKSDKKSLFDEALEIDDIRGNSDMSDLVAAFTEMKSAEKKARKSKSLLDRFEARMSSEPREKSKTRSLEDIASELDKEYNTTEYSDRVKEKRELDVIRASENKEINNFERRANQVFVKKNPSEVKSLRQQAIELDKKYDTNKYSAMVDAKESRDKARKEKDRKDKSYDNFMKEFDKDSPNVEKLKAYGKDYENISGSSSLIDAALQVEKTQIEEKAEKDRIAKDTEYAKMKKEAEKVDGSLASFERRLKGVSINAKKQKTLEELADELDAKYNTNKYSIAVKKKRLQEAMVENVKKDKKDKEEKSDKIKRLANEIDQEEGTDTYSNLVDIYESKGSSVEKTIKKALIDAGFEKRDFTGNPTGMVDWKAIVKDSKDVEKTLNKIMAVIPDASPAMEAILRERITDAITEKKKKAIENFIKSRQRSDEMKKRNATSRPTRLDRLMDLYKIGDIKKPEILQLIAEDFGIKESSVLDEKFITEWGAKRADAAANERWLEVAELDEKMQAFLDARANPNFSADRIQSDFVQALLASPVTSMQNATNLYDTALFSPIFDNLIAQVSRKGVGDKFIMKATLKAVGKAFIVAFDQVWNGGVDVISAQAERTGNRENAPRVRYYEHSRKSTGQKGNRFIRFRNAADDPRQKLIRLFPRLNAFTDAFGGVITQETKTYLALREGYIDQGYTLRQASEKAWDILNHDAFSAAFAQAAKEYPNANKLRQKRRAYEILEGNVFKENKEAFRRGQLSANIANLKSPDLGILSGIGWLINYMANPISSAFKSLEKRTDNETFKKMLKAVDATIGNMLRGVTLFLKPSLYFAENAIKYAATAHPALAVYTAIRLFAMGGMNLVAGKKEYDAHRISKDIGRGIVGYLLYLAMGMDDEEEREKKLIGTGPKDKIKGIPESEQAAFRTWDGISFNMLGPMALYAQVKSTEGNNKRFREDQSVFSIVNMMALAPFTEGIARAYKQIDSEKSGYDIISEYIAQRSGMAINPLARTFNDVGGTLDYKQKPIGIKDKFLASVGLSIMIDRPMVDAYGNEYYVGSTNAYSLDGMFSKHLIEHAERNKALNDYRQKYNVPLESLVERKFAKYYDKQLATIMDEELRYDISVKASKIRGEVFTNYINMYPEGRVKPLSDTEYQTELAKYDKEDQQAIKDGKKVLLQEMNASGKYRAELYDVGNTDVTNAIKDAKIFGRTYLEQIPITIIEKEIGSDFSKMNSAAKKYARFFVAKEQKLDLSPLMNWGEIDKEIETLNDYGYKEKDGTE